MKEFIVLKKSKVFSTYSIELETDDFVNAVEMLRILREEQGKYFEFSLCTCCPLTDGMLKAAKSIVESAMVVKL